MRTHVAEAEYAVEVAHQHAADAAAAILIAEADKLASQLRAAAEDGVTSDAREVV